VVGAIKVYDHEVDVVGAEVFCSPKLHRENTPILCLIGFEINLA
jgi:hypothetical protein